jgi:hypothetical protein
MHLNPYVEILRYKGMKVEGPKCTQNAVGFFNTIKKHIKLLNIVIAGGKFLPIQ